MATATTLPHLAQNTPGPGIPYAPWNTEPYRGHAPYEVVVCPACGHALPDHPAYARHWEAMVDRENRMAQEDGTD